MRSLQSNQKTIYYSAYLGVAEEKVNGKYTGEYVKSYGTIKPYKICVMPSSGSVSVSHYGVEAKYDYTCTTTDMNCPINEYAKVWVDAPVTAQNDHYVSKIERSINSIVIGLKKAE